MANDKQVIVITGSSGRIGTRIIERLGENYQSIGLDFVGITAPVPTMEFVFVDLSSDHSVDTAFKRIKYAYGNKIASVIHLAAYYSFSGEHLENYDKITVQGTQRLLRNLKDFEVDQFLFTSTMLVHKPTEPGKKITEDSPLEGNWAYPESKIRTEKVIREEHGNIPYVILRIAGCYDDECNCIPISQHMQRIYEKQLASYLFPGDTSHGVCYIHFDDLVDMIMLLVERRKDVPKDLVLLCAEEDYLSYDELQKEFGTLIHDKPWHTIHIPKSVAKIGAWVQDKTPFMPPAFIKPWMIDLADEHYEVSMEKARQVLGWSPKRTLRKTLPLLVDNLKADPIKWYKRHNIPLSAYVKRHAKEQ